MKYDGLESAIVKVESERLAMRMAFKQMPCEIKVG